ncbi:MAG: thioesterase family protein [Actinomycetia bacterium]|nr:thioesterase family protein [Actinomycetes bacterium]
MSYFVDVPMRWSDMDAYGHINNVQFLRLLEDARVVAFADWFGQDRSLVDEGVLVARHEIEYLAPLTFRQAPVRVRMWTMRLTPASFDVGYEVGEAEPDPATPRSSTVYARAETTLVLYDFATSRPRRMSPELEDSLLSYAGGEVRFRWRRR